MPPTVTLIVTQGIQQDQAATVLKWEDLPA
jgi:hypothetical protein